MSTWTFYFSISVITFLLFRWPGGGWQFFWSFFWVASSCEVAELHKLYHRSGSGSASEWIHLTITHPPKYCRKKYIPSFTDHIPLLFNVASRSAVSWFIGVVFSTATFLLPSSATSLKTTLTKYSCPLQKGHTQKHGLFFLVSMGRYWSVVVLVSKRM